MPHLDETGEENKPKAIEYMSPAERRGNGKSEDADIELKELNHRAVPRRSLAL